MMSMENDDLLPADITIDILSRLPILSILECKRVCKTWRNLLLAAPFAYAHIHRQLLDHRNHSNAATSTATGVGFLIRTSIHEETRNRLYYVTYEENDEQFSYKTLIKIDNHHPHDMRLHYIVGSCNGLICFSQINFKYGRHMHAPIYIYNPITREYVNLPRLSINFSNVYTCARVVYGFGYHPSRNEYKVVMIYYNIGEPLVGRSQVYTLGSHSGWRNKGEITCCLGYNYSSGILANGTLHWLATNGKVVAFDLAGEKFELFPSPPYAYLDKLYFCQLKVLAGHLCFVSNQNYGSTSIWSLNKENSEWKIMFRIALKDDSIDGCHFYVPFALTKQGEVLLQHNFSTVFRYDPKSGNLKVLDMSLTFHEAQPHIESFISLKALGEDDVNLVT